MVFILNMHFYKKGQMLNHANLSSSHLSHIDQSDEYLSLLLLSGEC